MLVLQISWALKCQCGVALALSGPLIWRQQAQRIWGGGGGHGDDGRTYFAHGGKLGGSYGDEAAEEAEPSGEEEGGALRDATGIRGRQRDRDGGDSGGSGGQAAPAT